MQSRLPDINNAFVKYRSVVLSHLDMKDYEGCFAALFAINGLLPAEYRVTISTEEYMEKTQSHSFAICSKCEKEIDYDQVKVYNLSLFDMEALLLGQQFVKVWDCPECKHQNQLFKTKIIRTAFQEPNFWKVVPKPPMRKDGVQSRMSYDRKARQWVGTMLVELEAQLANYRDDNWKKEEQLALEQMTEE